MNPSPRKSFNPGRMVMNGCLLYFTAILAYAVIQSLRLSPSSYYKFLFVAAPGIILFLRARRWRPETQAKLALSTVSTLLGIYLVEIYLERHRVVKDDSLAHFAALARQQGMPYDTRSRLEVVRDLRAAGQPAYPNVGPAEFAAADGILLPGQRVFPLGSISRVQTVLENDSGYYPVYRSDEHGFNNPPGTWTGSLQVLLVGDSFAQGCNVQPGRDVSSLLRDRGWPVLNLGQAGNGPLLELADVREFARPLRVPHVVWFYYEGNDLWDSLVRDRKSELLMRYLREEEFSQQLRQKQSEIDEVLARYADQRYAEAMEEEAQKKRILPKLLRVAKLYNLRTTKPKIKTLVEQESNPDPLTDPLFGEILEQTRNTVSGWNGKFYFVYLPEINRFLSARDEHNFRHRDHVLGIVTGLGIPVIDMYPVFSSQPDPLTLFPFRALGHYNENGYRLVADEIARNLPPSDPR